MKVFMYLFFFIMVLGCNNERDRLNCYSSSLGNIIRTKEYKLIMEQVAKGLLTNKELDINNPMKDSSFIISTKIDDALFFNKKKDKCLLLLLQKTANDLKLDQVKIIQGSLKNGTWYFSYNRLPEVPEITYTLNKETKNGININSSFSELSKESRMFVLSAGTINLDRCDIDEAYWFGN